MFIKNDRKSVTKEIPIIKKQTNKYKMFETIKTIIDNNIHFLKKELKEFKLVKIGSYAINDLYNFENEFEVDILATKYIDSETFDAYFKELNGKVHFSDCWMCELNNDIYEKLNKIYSNNKNIYVRKNTKFYKIYSGEIEFEDSVELVFNVKNKYFFSIKIRSAICNKKHLPIICDEKTYRKSFAIEYVKTFKSLNKLTCNKLSILFFYLKKEYHKQYSRKQFIYIRHKILADILANLVRGKFLSEWVSNIYLKKIKNSNFLEKLLSDKNIFLNKNKTLKNISSYFKLNNLKWVFNSQFKSAEYFLNHYLDYVEKIPDLELAIKNKEKLFLLHSINVYLKSPISDKTFTIKNNENKFKLSDVKSTIKNVHPSIHENESLILFMNFFQVEFYYIGDEAFFTDKRLKKEDIIFEVDNIEEEFEPGE